MKKKTKPKGYRVSKNTETGRIIKTNIAEEIEEWGEVENWEERNSLVSDDSEKPMPLKIIPCPYHFDDSKMLEKITEPIKEAKFRFEFDFGIFLAAKPREHTHELHFEGDELIDWAGYGLLCALYYDVSNNIEVKYLNLENKENDSVKQLHNEITEEVAEKADWFGSHDFERKEERLKNHELLFAQTKEYFEKHFVNEIKRVVDRFDFEIRTLNERGEDREVSIRLILENEEKELRKRLSIPKGRVPLKLQKDFDDERERFIYQCFAAFSQLQKMKRKINKTELTKILFSRESNPYQSLRRKLKTLNLSFEEVLHKYNEQKSS